MESALYSLQEVVSRVVEEPVKPFAEAGNGILLLPYTEDYATVRALLDKYSPRIVLGHLAVTGAVVGRHEYQPKEGISPDCLNPEILILLGHYHKRQVVASNLRYIGSAMAIDFNDANEQKGFTILDTETLETEFVPVGTTRFRILQQGGLVDSSYENDIVRVDHSGDVDEEATRATLLERGAAAVIFKRTVARQVEQRVTDPETDLVGCMKEYVSRNNTTGLSSERLVELGQEIVREAKGDLVG